MNLVAIVALRSMNVIQSAVYATLIILLSVNQAETFTQSIVVKAADAQKAQKDWDLIRKSPIMIKIKKTLLNILLSGREVMKMINQSKISRKKKVNLKSNSIKIFTKILLWTHNKLSDTKHLEIEVRINFIP